MHPKRARTSRRSPTGSSHPRLPADLWGLVLALAGWPAAHIVAALCREAAAGARRWAAAQDTVEISGPTAGATLALLRAARAWPSKRHLRLRDFEFYHNGAWRALGRDLGPRALDSVTCDLPSAQNFRKYAEFTMRALHITSFSPEHGFHLRADHPMRAIEIRHAAARCCHPAFLRLRRDTAESRTAAAGPDAAGLALAQQPFDQWPPVRAAAIDSIVFPQHQYATHVDTLALVFWSLLPTIHDGPIADHVERTRPRRLLVHEIDSDTVHTLLVRDRRDTLAFLRSAASSRDGHARHWRLFKSYQHREPSYLAVDRLDDQELGGLLAAASQDLDVYAHRVLRLRDGRLETRLIHVNTLARWGPFLQHARPASALLRVFFRNHEADQIAAAADLAKSLRCPDVRCEFVVWSPDRSLRPVFSNTDLAAGRLRISVTRAHRDGTFPVCAVELSAPGPGLIAAADSTDFVCGAAARNPFDLMRPGARHSRIPRGPGAQTLRFACALDPPSRRSRLPDVARLRAAAGDLRNCEIVPAAPGPAPSGFGYTLQRAGPTAADLTLDPPPPSFYHSGPPLTSPDNPHWTYPVAHTHLKSLLRGGLLAEP